MVLIYYPGFSKATLCQPHQVHAVPEVSDFSFTRLNDPFDVIDARAKICKFALQFGLFLNDTNKHVKAVIYTKDKKKIKPKWWAVPACWGTGVWSSFAPDHSGSTSVSSADRAPETALDVALPPSSLPSFAPKNKNKRESKECNAFMLNDKLNCCRCWDFG